MTNTKLNKEISRENDVLRIAYVDGQYIMVQGENNDCPSLTDIIKNWDKAENFEPKSNNNISSLSSFVRNFVQPCLSLMNEGNIARGVKDKPEEEIKKQAIKLEESINLSINGIEANKESKIKRRIGLKEKVESLNELTNTNISRISDVEKAQYFLDYFKIKKAISQLQEKAEKYNQSKFVDIEIYNYFVNQIEELSSSLENSFKRIS